MRVSILLAAIAACVLLLATAAQASVTTGTITSKDGFAFASKFCFQTGAPAGGMTASLLVPVYTPGQTEDFSDIIMLWWDDEALAEHGSWDAMLKNWDTWTCEEKVASAKFPLTATVTSTEHTTTLAYSTYTISQLTRPRFWYSGFARCKGGFDSVDFKVHAVQAGASSWTEEFGMNEQGLNTLYLAFFLFLTILISVHSRGTYVLMQKLSYLHPLLKLFLICLILEYISQFVLLLHYGTYSSNGVGIVVLMKLGQVLSIVSRCFFMLLLILVAKGWTISNEQLTRKWVVIAFVLTYLVVAIFLLLWSYAVEDPKRLDLQPSVKALTIVLNVVWLIFAGWFSIQIFVFSYRKEQNPVKRGMYCKLGCLMSFWFIFPAVVSLAVFAMDPWARERIVAGFTVTITTVAYTILVFLFWPSRAEEYFSIATPDVQVGRDGSEDYNTL